MKLESEKAEIVDLRTIDRLLDQREVANILCVSEKMMEYWRWKGGGPKYVKVGKLARYRESDISSTLKN